MEPIQQPYMHWPFNREYILWHRPPAEQKRWPHLTEKVSVDLGLIWAIKQQTL